MRGRRKIRDKDRQRERERESGREGEMRKGGERYYDREKGENIKERELV
jgi:hypothetical protein